MPDVPSHESQPQPSTVGHDPGHMRVTHIGTATLLLEIGGLRLLTDPVLDPAGSAYQIGKTGLVRYVNLDGPALPAQDVASVDAVLLSHDQHKDNLDRAGMAVVEASPLTITTPEGAHRLATRRIGDRAVGLSPFESRRMVSPTGLEVTITAAPARHGPPGTRWLTGTVTGFLLEWPGQTQGAVYITGDTRFFAGIETIARRFDIGTCFVHAGSGCFPATGPIRYSMDGKEAVAALDCLQPRRVVPIHYDGWSHFSESPDDLRAALGASGHAVTWLPKGAAVDLAC